MRNEDYGRISRLLADRTPVELEFNIVNQSIPRGRTLVQRGRGDPGHRQEADEVVMLGGHLDSWHAATGATDNAIGCAVMMEAARILKAIGVQAAPDDPRGAVERRRAGPARHQGLCEGALRHLREPEAGIREVRRLLQRRFRHRPHPRRERVRTRRAAAVLREALAPFEDLGVLGASSTRSRRTGGTDSTSFNEAGLPGIGLGQDPIEYGTYTWHTNLDTYERIVEDDVKNSAIAIAAAVYHLAMRDEMLPRFSQEQMPAPPAATAR